MTATLSYATQDYDDIRIIVTGQTPAIINITDRSTAVELYRVLIIAYYDDHTGPLHIDVDGHDYMFCEQSWKDLISVTEQWLEIYLPIHHSNLFPT